MKLTGDVHLVESGSSGIGPIHELDCGGELALVDTGAGLD